MTKPAPTRPADTLAARLTAAAVSRVYDVTPQAVHEWKTAGAPFDPDGRVTLAALRRWELERTRAVARRGPTDAADEAKTRKAIADARRAELRAAREAGQLVTVADALAIHTRRLERIRQALDVMPSRWAPRIVGVADIGTAFVTMREMWGDALTACQRADPDDPPDSPTVTTDAA